MDCTSDLKTNVVEKAKLQADLTKTNHPLHKLLHQLGNLEAGHFKIKYIRDTYFTPKKGKMIRIVMIMKYDSGFR
ncbi:hypothetical protein RIR_jg1302.t1 [Rhizophagus irregularis DAOM 181602=DAOM 197198]|uniref:Uncharacterized protein n=1 Tax=Rhizophagus irregularis (strain DAOM 181602 / DAOM 197198 / MUCL 43194) TaxID=747089 RepID=U9UWE3_RHIID|nr:hypothetical protein RIR_jg1302.t1 [Rhizophagus irregularis DAOM 181602=DAOM 197198]